MKPKRKAVSEALAHRQESERRLRTPTEILRHSFRVRMKIRAFCLDHNIEK